MRSFLVFATPVFWTLLPGPGLGAVQAQTGPLPEPDQRVVLVTGSTSGLGREVARSLAAEGAHVIVHGRSAERGLALVDEINDSGTGSARFYAADFASLDRVRELAAAIRREYDRLDVLVNNAGVIVQERRMSEDGYELTFQVNYLAHYLLTRELIPLLRDSAPARIVSVSSIASSPLEWDDPMGLESPYEAGAAYGRSKRAQVMHTVDLALELAGSGVVANALHPETFMDTNMVLSMGAQPRSSVLDGRDNVLQLIDAEVGSGDFYLEGKPTRSLHEQAWDARERGRLRTLSDRLVAPGSE
jgi:NAD(P)-dependent dehydrogenase (short-subunit alcohol dehydrogenase family)